MGNRSSTSRTVEGQNNAVTNNKRKRDDSEDAELRVLKQPPTPMQQQQHAAGIVSMSLDTNSVPSLSIMPETVLLHIFSFVLKQQRPMFRDRSNDTLAVQLALEKTCRRFSALLGRDSTMKLLYEGRPKVEFDYQVASEREEMFLQRAIGMIKHFQKRTDTLICEYMGGADGVRNIVDRMLVKMKVPRYDSATYIGPPQFPENGFKLFLRGDSVAYLTEVVEQHMVSRLNSAMKAALFRSNPPSSHPYPMISPHDILFVDMIRVSEDLCVVCPQHARNEVHSCSRLCVGNSPKMWKWPDDNCLEEEIIGVQQRQRMVRAIASRAGIVKLTGGAFDCIAAEILHFMSIIVVDAFEASKSLWRHHDDIGYYLTVNDNEGIQFAVADIDDTIIIEDDRSSDSSWQSHEVDYSNLPPPPSETLDEAGEQLCVIIPRQIKDAAVRIGMKPILDSRSWEAGEGRSRDEEIDSDSDEESDEDDDPEDNNQVCYCAACLENGVDEDAPGDEDAAEEDVEVEVGAIENVAAGIDENVGKNIR
eukprot:scaffold39111_cov126-Skeletonema_marinoi.AAC.5